MIDLSKVPVGLDFTVKSKLKKSVKMAAIYDMFYTTLFLVREILWLMTSIHDQTMANFSLLFLSNIFALFFQSYCPLIISALLPPKFEKFTKFLLFHFRTSFRKLPCVEGQEIDLYLLYWLVTAQGGWEKVSLYFPICMIFLSLTGFLWRTSRCCATRATVCCTTIFVRQGCLELGAFSLLRRRRSWSSHEKFFSCVAFLDPLEAPEQEES